MGKWALRVLDVLGRVMISGDEILRAAKELPGATAEVRQDLCAGDGGADVPQPDQDVEYSPYAIKVAASPAAGDVSPRAARRHRRSGTRRDHATGEAGDGVF